MYLTITRYYAKACLLLLTLTLTVAELIEQAIVALEPAKHGSEWIACLAGAVIGQIKLGSKNFWRFIIGIAVGYLAGLYGGVDFADRCGLSEPLLGRFLAAALADRLFRILEFVLSNPTETADFVIEKGSKLASILSDDVWGKALGHVKGFFTKKTP